MKTVLFSVANMICIIIWGKWSGRCETNGASSAFARTQQTSWLAEGHDLSSAPEMVTLTSSSPPAEAPEDSEQEACHSEISSVAPSASPVLAEPLLDTSAAEKAVLPPTSGE